MSAVIFPMSVPTNKPKPPPQPQHPHQESRIPVPSSPAPLRRSGSLRLAGKLQSAGWQPQHSTRQEDSKNPSSSYQQPSIQQQDSGAKTILLRRTNSLFMERRGGGGGGGDKGVAIRHGAQSAAVASSRTPGGTTTESRNFRAPQKGHLTPQSPSRIRSLSLSLSNAHNATPTRLSAPRSPATATASPRTPPTSPDVVYRNNLAGSGVDWDTSSITSITSLASVGSCDHASVARNGTTFSGRSMKYVFHCNQHSGATGEDYLTPTQRVHRQVKKLQHVLHQAKKDLDEKDSEILKLTKEVVELRLYKAALNSPEEQSNSSSENAVTVKENATDDEATPEIANNVHLDVTDECGSRNIDGLRENAAHSEIMTSSYSDSGHFDEDLGSTRDEDLTKASPFKRKSDVQTADKAVTAAMGDNSGNINLIMEYEKRLQELIKTHEEESHQLKQKHNDKVEELLQRITEINQRYWELVPELDLAKEKIRELESQLEEACDKLQQQEEKQKDTNLEMYNKGLEAAQLERENKAMEMATQGPSRISVPELLQELQVTKNELENIKDIEYASTSNNLTPLLSAKEALSLWVLGARKAMYRQLVEAKNRSKIDPEITLQFLKSAIYYFLTDKENSQGHLKAIQSILGFTPNEISNIEKARLS